MAEQTLSEAENECLSLKKSINENYRLSQKAASDAIERGVLVGELLAKWKELLPHGRFETFVDTHFEGSTRTAQLYMQAAKRLTECSKAQRIALLDGEVTVKGLIGSIRSTPVAAGREARKPAGTPATPKGGSNPPATAVSGKDDRTDSPGTTPQEPSTGQSGSDTDNPVDLGICPNCGGKKWTQDEFGASCAKCNHPHGEPVGDQDEQRVGVERSKAIKTVEALMRSVCDLGRLLPKPKEQAHLIAQCKLILTELRAWK